MGNPALRSLLVVGATAVLSTCAPWRNSIALVDRPVGASTRQSGRHSLGQQDGQDRLGVSYERRRVHPEASCGAQHAA